MVRPSKTGVTEVFWWGSLALFLFPFVALFSIVGRGLYQDSLSQIDFGEFYWAFQNSLILGLVTATFVTAVGLFFAWGLQWLKSRNEALGHLISWLLMIPIYLPPFFIILSFLYWLSFAPLGVFSSAFVLGLSYLGFAAVFFSAAFSERVGDLSEVGQVFGLSRWKFLRTVFPLLMPVLVAFFVFVFAGAFSSFSVPLVLGGGKGTTVEILVYEKVRISFDLKSAVVFSTLQSLFLALVTLKFPFEIGSVKTRRSSGDFLKSKVFVVPVLAYLTFVLGPWLIHPFTEGQLALTQLNSAPGFMELFVNALLRSLQISFVAAFVSFLFSLVCIYLWIRQRSLVFLRLMFPISVALLGLVGIILTDRFRTPLLIYVLLNLILIFPLLYRLFLWPGLSLLKDQFQAADVMGANSVQVLQMIALPQLAHGMATVVGMSFLWTLGDFALVRYFFPSGTTLTLLIENLMSSYRIQGAMTLGFCVLLVGGLVQWFLWRMANVLSPKS